VDAQQGAVIGVRRTSSIADAPPGLALLEHHATITSVSGSPPRADVTSKAASAASRCVFEGIALGPGVYVDAADRRIRVRAELLPLVAERMRGVFLRDLHREDLGASVGVVEAARVEAGEVRFTGDVRLAPYVDIVREFWRNVRFSLGFRYDAAQLAPNEDGTFDLPADFLIDHLALVPQGQYANARLVRLLNQARAAPAREGLGALPDSGAQAGARPAASPGALPDSGAQAGTRPAAFPGAFPDPGAGAGTRPAASLGALPDSGAQAGTRPAASLGALPDSGAQVGTRPATSKPPRSQPSMTDTEATVQAEAASEASRRELEQARADREAALAAAQRAEAASEASRGELAQAKNRLAAEVMKLELAAGKDFDLDQRKRELTGLDLGALDKLRGELRLAADDAASKAGGSAALALATRPEPAPRAEAKPAKAEGLDLVGVEALSFTDTLRLAFQQGVL
jgi:hypothetical protein